MPFFSRLNRCNSFSRYRASLADSLDRRKKKSVDDLPVLVTCRSGTLAILSGEVNGLVAHGSTR